MLRYKRPLLIKTYSLSELRADAAACTIYQPTMTVTAVSDERLKMDIELV
jgi:hypothetical protein